MKATHPYQHYQGAYPERRVDDPDRIERQILPSRSTPRANKQQIKKAIEQQFKVQVASVNTMNYDGKLGTRRGGSTPGRRAAWKKAVVTLREGQAIELI